MAADIAGHVGVTADTEPGLVADDPAVDLDPVVRAGQVGAPEDVMRMLRDPVAVRVRAARADPIGLAFDAFGDVLV